MRYQLDRNRRKSVIKLRLFGGARGHWRQWTDHKTALTRSTVSVIGVRYRAERRLSHRRTAHSGRANVLWTGNVDRRRLDRRKGRSNVTMTIIYLLVLAFVLGGGGWLAWQFFGANGAMFGASRDSRIGVSESVTVEGKRKLLLIYRDGVEHLVMTGGPIDVVIEQGIQPPQHHQPMPTVAATRTASYEPRLAAQAAAGPSLEQTQESPAGFGRLRQRPTPAHPADSGTRSEPMGQASGSNGR